MKIEGKSSQGEAAHPVKGPDPSLPPSGEKKTLGKLFEESVRSEESTPDCTIMGHIEAGMENVTDKIVEETSNSIGLQAILGKDPAENPWDYFWQGYADHVGKCVSKKEKGK